MQINGIIKGDITIIGNRVTYDVNEGNREYHVLSEGNQAVKDAIFLRKGQNIEVSGTPSDDIILSNKSIIDISKIAVGD